MKNQTSKGMGAPPARATGGRKPRVKAEIIAALAKRILSGEFAAGESIPKENDLCIEYGVSRTVIREAAKVLESKGLLRIRSRVGTQVLDASEWNMLDPEILDWTGTSFHAPEFIKSLMEARRIIEPAAVRLAAQRATASDLARIEDAYHRMCASLPHDVAQCSAADLDFHQALLQASHNHVLVRLSSVIGAAMRSLFELSVHLGSQHEQALHLHGAVLEAVRLRDPEAAVANMESILDSAGHDLTRVEAPTTNGGEDAPKKAVSY